MIANGSVESNGLLGMRFADVVLGGRTLDRPSAHQALIDACERFGHHPRGHGHGFRTFFVKSKKVFGSPVDSCAAPRKSQDMSCGSFL
jgi:hypothetical protein